MTAMIDMIELYELTKECVLWRVEMWKAVEYYIDYCRSRRIDEYVSEYESLLEEKSMTELKAFLKKVEKQISSYD